MMLWSLWLTCVIFVEAAGMHGLDILYLTKNASEYPAVLPLHDSIKDKIKDKLKVTFNTLTVDTSEPFASLSTVRSQWPDHQLFLLSSSLCGHLLPQSWLEVVALPIMCYHQVQHTRTADLIYRYYDTCLKLHHTHNAAELKHCLQAIQARPTMENQLGDMIATLNWTHITVLFEDDMDVVAASISMQLSSIRIQSVLYRVSSDMKKSGISSLLKLVLDNLSVMQRNFLLLCSGNCGRIILHEADLLNDRATAMKMTSKWLLVLPMDELCLLQSEDFALDNVAAFLLPSSVRYVKGNSDIRPDGYAVTLLYKPGSRQWSAVGYVDTFGYMVITEDIFPNRYFGFNKRRLLITTILLEPFSMKRMDENNNTIYEGICIDLLIELSVTFNFTYEVIEPPDGEYGRLLNGTWTGAVGQLERQEVDMAVAPLTVTQEREAVMDFVYPYYYDTGKGVYKLPDQNALKWRTLIRPFKWEVFMCIGFVFILMSLLISSSEIVEIKRQKHLFKTTSDIISDSVWLILSIFFKHGSYQHLHSRSGYIVMGFLWMFCIIILSIYCGNLIAFLTVSKNSPPFKTLAEVVSQSEYTWGTNGGSMWTTLFETSNRSDYQKIWAGIKREAAHNPSVLGLKNLVHKEVVLEGSYLFIFDGDVIAVWSEEHCDVKILEETFYQITYAVALPQNSPYGMMLSEKMLKIEQSGLVQIWKGRWWAKGNNCDKDMRVQATAIELIDLQGAFYILSAGVGMSCLVLLLEYGRRLTKQ